MGTDANADFYLFFLQEPSNCELYFFHDGRYTTVTNQGSGSRSEVAPFRSQEKKTAGQSEKIHTKSNASSGGYGAE